MKDGTSDVPKRGTFAEHLVALTKSGTCVVECSGTKKLDGAPYLFVKIVKIDEVVATKLMIYVIGKSENFKTSKMEDTVLQVPLNHVNAEELVTFVAG